MNTGILGITTIIVLCGLATIASAQEIKRTVDQPTDPISLVVAVPPGYTIYYISGEIGKPVTPAADGKPADWGNTTQETRSVLDTLKQTMSKAGLTFGDVVKATVYMAPSIDFAEMNKVWKTEFGTSAQPNRPARAAIHITSMGSVGPQLEIEFIAAKK